MQRSLTFINKKAIVPNYRVNVWKHNLSILHAARVHTARHCRDPVELNEILEMLGISIGVENETQVC